MLTATSAVPGSTCLAGSPCPGCAATVTIVADTLSIKVPATAYLGSVDFSASPRNLTGQLGSVQVTDDRGFGADWTAAVAATGFTTGTGTPAERPSLPATSAMPSPPHWAQPVRPPSPPFP